MTIWPNRALGTTCSGRRKSSVGVSEPWQVVRTFSDYQPVGTLMPSTYSNFRQSKKGKSVAAQMAGTLRSVHFIERAKTIAEVEAQRALGFENTYSFGLAVSPVMELNMNVGWKRNALERVDDIASALIAGVVDLVDGEPESFAERIRDTIHDSLRNAKIFNLGLRHDKTSLFDFLSQPNPMDSIDELLNRTYIDLKGSLSSWLTIFPCPRLKSEPFSVGLDGLSLVNPRDQGLVNTLSNTYTNFEKWYHSTLRPGNKNFSSDNAMWITCQVHGTVDGARTVAARRMRSFVAVTLAVMRSSQNILLRVKPDTENYAVQFPTKSSAGTIGEQHASIGSTFPSIAGEIELKDEDRAEILSWYRRREASHDDVRQRFMAASQFINYALNADGLARFVYFFVSLDAMFGERGRVEEKIRNGVIQTFPNEPLWVYKIGQLFDLRSTIVHGGCSALSEWPKRNAYIRHAKTLPERDVAVAAMTALLSIV